MVELLQTFWNDGKVEVLVILVALDFVLGVFAALKLGIFRLSYVADFLRKDVLFKMGAYLGLYAGSYYAGEANILLEALDMGVLAGSAYVVILAAMVGSIMNSVRELGLIPGVAQRESSVDQSAVDMVTADEGI